MKGVCTNGPRQSRDTRERRKMHAKPERMLLLDCLGKKEASTILCVLSF